MLFLARMENPKFSRVHIVGEHLDMVTAARESGLHAIQFTTPDACRAELRTYLPDLGL